jgi:Tol biopolymer transport system component
MNQSKSKPRVYLTVLAMSVAGWAAGSDTNGFNYPARQLLPAAWKATWSPDSKNLAFTRRGGGISVLELESRRVTDLRPDGKDPAWSPDGKFIAYVSGKGERGETFSEEVWVLPAQGGEPVKIGRGGFPAWTADSQRVLFHSRNQSKILSVGVAAPQESPAVFFESPASSYSAISPDGSRIASGGGGKLTVFETKTGQAVASLATPDEPGFLPGWSPDGRLVAFGGFSSGRAGLWIFDVERGGAYQLAKDPGCTMPAWSPDGKYLVFDVRAGTDALERALWVINTESLPRNPVLTNQLPPRVIR